MPYRRAMRRDQIALQLYTVRRLMAADLPGTLRAVADAGYGAVELAGLPPIDPARLADLFASSGLRAFGAHEGIDRLRAEPDAIADRLAVLGCDRIVVPSMPEGERGSVTGVRRFAAEMGALAARLEGRGFRLGYHNHDAEFAPLDGTTAWAVLLDELPGGVEIELDVYWASVAGRDPVAEIRAAADRVRLLHMKDRSAGADARDLPAGSGILAFPAIVEAGRAAGVEWYVAEQDEPGDALADIAVAARYLGSLAS